MPRRSPPTNSDTARHGPGTDESQNESTPVAQRTPDVVAPKTQGIQRGPANEVLPGSYRTKASKGKILREDR